MSAIAGKYKQVSKFVNIHMTNAHGYNTSREKKNSNVKMMNTDTLSIQTAYSLST